MFMSLRRSRLAEKFAAFPTFFITFFLCRCHRLTLLSMIRFPGQCIVENVRVSRDEAIFRRPFFRSYLTIYGPNPPQVYAKQ